MFHPERNSIWTFPYFAAEFNDFFRSCKGKDVKPDVDLKEYSKRIRKSDDVIKHISQDLDIIRSAGSETTDSMYKPLSRILTRISLDIDASDEVLVFIRTSQSALRVTDGGRDFPDLVAFFASRNQAQRALVGEAIAVPSAHKIITVVEMKMVKDPVSQCLRYMFTVSRHHPASRRQYGFVMKKSYFQLLSLNLDTQTKWDKVELADASTYTNVLYSCVKLIRDEARRSLHEAMPALIETREIQGVIFAFYRAIVGGKPFRLLPIFSGRGNGRKPFIALAAAEGNPKDIRVFKYSWYPRYRLGRERNILKKIGKAPGVVQIDDALSNDSLEKDGLDGRERSLLVLKTVGHPLCSCSSVQEFLEAMYDLLEVLRYLVQEKNIMHRDISWGNVLINRDPTPDTEMPLGLTNEPIKHRYRFISNIFNENQFRIRVSLTDFDYACDLTQGQKDKLSGATGTPMFMAGDVLQPEEGDTRLSKKKCAKISQAALEDCVLKYYDEEEKAQWDNYYASLHKMDWEESEDPRASFRHAAVHDAESVYWLCVLFFNRMWRKHPLPGEKGDARSEGTNRGEAFRTLASKKIDMDASPFAKGLSSKGFDESFWEMLNIVNRYVTVSWKDVAITQRGQPYEFHLHDLMQRLILRELRKLRDGDGIPIEDKPLRVFCTGLFGNSYASASGSQGPDTVLGVGPDTVLGKRSAADIENEKSDQPIPSPPDVQEGFPRLLWDILREKNREKLWLVADKLE